MVNFECLSLKHPLKILLTTVLFIVLIASSAFSETVPTETLSQSEITNLGEQMYRRGILPSGKPLPAYIRGDLEVDSSAFSCSSCHLRAGLGSYEGGIITPPTTGNKLYKKYRRPLSPGDPREQSKRSFYAETVVERPPYTREGIANALRLGIDPAGHEFNDVMPRYQLNDKDISILVRYLEQLSSQASPGATNGELRFATIVTDDVNQDDRQALLQPLEAFITHQNQQLSMYNDFIKFGYKPTVDMKFAFRKASLEVWELKGPPEGWGKQLELYYRTKPVFAVLSGISNQDWKPIHDFCEEMRLPCLFPITEYPSITGTGWYTYYFNKGYFQEGETVARYLNRQETDKPDSRILQIVQDSPAGRGLARGFDSTWGELERPVVTSVVLSAEQFADAKKLDALLKKHNPSVLLFWGDDTIIPHLPKAAELLPNGSVIFVSSTILGKKTATIADGVRDRVFITYPYRLTPYYGPNNGGYRAPVPIVTTAENLGDKRIISKINTALYQVVLQGMSKLNDNVLRDHLFDLMGMQMDLVVPDFERLSFGPSQRFASKGCYIIKLGAGQELKLIPSSEWVVQ